VKYTRKSTQSTGQTTPLKSLRLLTSAPLAALLAIGLLAATGAVARAQNTVSFAGSNGANPYGRVTIDSSGNLYGTAQAGGANSDGVVWKMAAGTHTISAVASFNGTNGNTPYGGVAIDGSGNLYGTTYIGGANNDGVVWKIAAGTSTLTTVASFNGTNGMNPVAGVTIDGSGNLYGTARNGGGSGWGCIWKIASGSSTITTVASFPFNGASGINPYGGVTIDGSGNLYGTTYTGGANTDGVVWKVASGSSTITVIASFNGTNGANPYDGVTIDGSGNLFGTTYNGGANSDGTVWEIASGTSTITTIASFNGTNGLNPSSDVKMDGAGNLYGTTTLGGASSAGTVWRIDSGTSTITTLASFNGGSTGSNPNSGVTIDSGGNLFGTTSLQGANSDGTVYEIPRIP